MQRNIACKQYASNNMGVKSMNIAIIGSGGDGAGMNECLYVLCKNLKQHNVILFNYGYQGIIDNNVATYSLATLRA